MFTGIIQDIGIIKSITKGATSSTLAIESSVISTDSVRGDSISVSGVCLTIKAIKQNIFHMDVMKETVEKSTLNYLETNSKVNLEKALTPNSLMGGHFVQGHVDNIGKVERLKKTPQYWELTINVGQDIMKYLLPKASIGLNGISLTIVDITDTSFTVSVIPTTYQDTNIAFLKKGDYINLEVDMMGKYVYHYVEQLSSSKSKLSKEYLIKNGF